MLPLSAVFLFAVAALLMVLTPGPNMIYLISSALTQGKKAGLISLFGVVSGFLFHILLVSFGLTAIFFAIPYAFLAVKILGVVYLLHLAYNAVSSKNSPFTLKNKALSKDSPKKLFQMGFLTNVLNPKMAFFYLSFFPQFIQPDEGSIFLQSIQLGIIQIMISFTVNFLIILFASRMAGLFSKNPFWIKVQKWIMASIFLGLAWRIAWTKAK